MNPRVLVVIVNYRSAGYACECLQTLVPELEQWPNLRVTVVDNGSGDDSAARLTEFVRSSSFANRMTVMPLAENRGFAAGNNAAIRAALDGNEPPDLVFLLNPDTLLRPSAVSVLVRFMLANPEIGIAGSRSEDLDGTPQVSCFRFHTPVGELLLGCKLGMLGRLLRKWEIAQPFRNETREADWVSGAAMMVRADVFRRIGLLDDGYFLYFEEQDFCLRARRADFRCWYVPDSRVVHLLGKSTGVTAPDRHRQRLPAYWFEARRRYFVKNFGGIQALAADLSRLVGHATWRVRCALQRKPNTDPDRFFMDLLRHSVIAKGFRL